MANAMAELRPEIATVVGQNGGAAVLQLIPCRWCSQRGEFRFRDELPDGKRVNRTEVCPQCNGWKKLYRVKADG